ncbi:hypothetical protein AaE_008136 [Aphanomyces astaci]|uniref:RING-type domain-containing protein n=1 Tax=Aphanomyces astaci TaxID=112090 RepID=A0A6A5A0R2_APHAT|nr:hypothetical protein AaE_008136 [Aphanomyces astaci]
MRSYPLLTTPCCNANVCFRCKSPGHHEQVSCAATLEALTHQDDLGQCPHCLMAVVMGDGCSLVTFFCGYQFYRQEGVKSFQFMKVLSAIKSKLQRVFLRFVRRRHHQRMLVDFLVKTKMRPHRQTWRHVCTYLRRHSSQVQPSTSPFANDEGCTASTQRSTNYVDIRTCMHSLWTRMICAVYRWRRDRVLDAVSVAVTTKSNWDSYWATVTAEDQVALDDDMHSVIDGHHGWL